MKLLKIFSISIISSFIMVLVISCSNLQKACVTKTDAYSGATSNVLVYSLPQTTLVIDVEIQHRRFEHGPYADYAKDLLGIKDVLRNDENFWVLTGCDITTNKEPDPSQYYSIAARKNKYLQGNLFFLASEGFIFDPLAQSMKSLSQIPDTVNNGYVPVYTNLNPNGFMGAKVTTYYKTVFKDSVFVSVPMHKEQLTVKTEEQAASETAKEIYKLRKRRVKMVSAQYTYVPEGEALEICLDELDKLEQEYLSLFVGKTLVDTFHYRFLITPTTERNSWQKSLCKFSKSEGLLPIENTKGFRITVSIAPDVEPLPEGVGNRDVKSNLIYYRIGEPCTVLVKQDDVVLLRQKVVIDQLGQLMSIPANMLLEKH